MFSHEETGSKQKVTPKVTPQKSHLVGGFLFIQPWQLSDAGLVLDLVSER